MILAELVEAIGVEAAKVAGQTISTRPGSTRNECSCPEPLRPGRGDCAWCVYRAASLASWVEAHPYALDKR